MPKKHAALANTLVLCMTLIVGLWMVRESLCELRYKDTKREFSASFVYEMK
ncbi:Hok/Gef family protein [Vibrio sp. OPT18]|uniref:Hok/Gef family protein n=1 Tax=Vibrio sp. OPT18 TaxID=2778641 RepID=UPI00188013A0|nr:Hok/Gef family protein [Vibrio sp. OPT18]MBE8574118.1 Hok/Gef family protein [Vibrio sp. OPT18]